MTSEKTMFHFVQKMEDLAAFLPCVADALNILHEELDQNLLIRQDYSGDMGCFLRISSAMVPALAELNRIREGLDAVVTAAYKQKKGEINGSNKG